MTQKTTQSLEPLSRISFEAEKLMSDHPPKLRNRNKQIVFRIACPKDAKVGGTIVYTRWWAMKLPQLIAPTGKTAVEARGDVYDYVAVDAKTPAMEWHVNFADPQLFVAYGSGLLAQDEMQVAEHPALGSLLEALMAMNEPTLTTEVRIPTPVLVRGVERRVKIATEPNANMGRPNGLYGNQFAAADIAAIENATTVISPPTISNLIAMAAPQGGSGKYERGAVQNILTTAYTGFLAARLEAERALGKEAKQSFTPASGDAAPSAETES